MINYKQTYKDDVIFAVMEPSGNIYDSSLSNDAFFSAVGQKTNSSINNITSNKLALYAIKQDCVLNLDNGSNISIYDDSGIIGNMDISGAHGKNVTNIVADTRPLYLSKTSTNIRFDGSALGTMTKPIADLRGYADVNDYTATVTLPPDVKCNYATGKHVFITDQSVNLAFAGEIKKGDTITINRNLRGSHTSTITFDTDLAFINLNMNNNTELELTYTHLNPVTPVPEPTPTKKYELEPTLQNATIIDPKPVNDHYYLDPNHTTITIKANAGYTFESDGSLVYQQDGLNQATLNIKATHTDTVTVSLPSNINWSIQQVFMLSMGAVKTGLVHSTGGFINIYKADYSNLVKFSNEVIVNTRGSQFASYDISPYINNLIMLPFDVPTGVTSSIVAGDETFKTQLPNIESNFLTIDLGKITVPEQYKNGFDYYQVKTRLVLPYTNVIELDPVHVINKTVAIKYFVNVITGDTTINLSNDDEVFYSDQVNLASEIPFISTNAKGSQYSVINKLKTMYRNNITQPYIIIEQPTPILNADYYKTNEKGTLKNYTGNVKASLLNNININSNELNALQNLLETGVKIK